PPGGPGGPPPPAPARRPGSARRRDGPPAGGPLPRPRIGRLLVRPAVRHAPQPVRLPADASAGDVRAHSPDGRRGGAPRPASRRARAPRRADRVRPGRSADRVLPEHGPRRPGPLLRRASRPMTAFDELLTWQESSTSGEAIAAALEAADLAPSAALDVLGAAQRIMVTGAGSSYYLAQAVAAAARASLGRAVIAAPLSELILRPDGVIV